MKYSFDYKNTPKPYSYMINDIIDTIFAVQINIKKI